MCLVVKVKNYLILLEKNNIKIKMDEKQKSY